MSMGRDMSVSRFWPGALRWSVAALVVAGAHAGAGWAILNWQQAEAAVGEPPAAVMIELAPIAVAPEAPPQEVAPGPEMVEAQPEPAPEQVVEKPPEEKQPEPEPVVKPVEPTPEVPLPVVQPEPEIKLPDMPQIADAPVVLPPPPPPPRPVVQRKPPPPKPRVAEKRKPIEPDRPPMRQTSAPPSAQAQTAPSMAAPSAGAASAPSVSPASWRGTLIAHLNRYKRFPGGASPGTVQVAFSIDRGGRVLSARLAGSSGDAILDEEAVAMVRRASPVPAPPQGVGGGTIALAVPVRFSR